jgi:hypothetical protein
MKKRTTKMKKLDETCTVSVAISCPMDKAYKFLSAPANFPQWASGLCTEIKKKDGKWVVVTPQGPAKIEFTKKNTFGILDHTVTLGRYKIYVPMRVLPNKKGCELLLTLYRNDMPESRFKEDIGWVERDLDDLKDLLEQTAGKGDANA